ncbi:acetolactate synthase 2 catalytic subunit [Parvularcula sp. LCG005]|uniref:acetolactate synthase 2 catalytic subunit n=1 Tax=Parvularcula sp. LCG005 TaxID=3078805 RepID=UPI002943B369|nr:acetolactate synthase 2 catalytic subunit [Parvularcula sp. LCG005]WOI53114.1 acetolactate synthase 2 catalytic subunit [Parvularcula sp. LCG005]
MNTTAPKLDQQTVARPKTGASLVVDSLLAQGVDTVFGYPGGAIMPVYDAIPGSGLRHILCRHEQACAFAAAAVGRMTRRAGVCFATSGPGATNLVTGIADAFMDSVPMVAITGQVAQPVMGTDAFQEIDTFGITMPIVKHSYIVRDPNDIPRIIAEAIEIAESGRPGPVVIDIPKDVQVAGAQADVIARVEHTDNTLDEDGLRRAEAAVRDASKPLFYLGGGIVRAGAVDAVRKLVERSKIPAVCTLQGLGVLPTGHPQLLGMLGMHGTKQANLAVQDCDLLIVVGARFDDRATGKLDTFAPHARVVHFDRDASEISKLRHAHVAVSCEIKPMLEAFRPEPNSIGPWQEQCLAWRDENPIRYDAPGEGIYAPALLKELSEQAGDKFVAVSDVGQHQMWVAQHCRFSRPQAHITSGGLGSMGFGLPTAIGAKVAEPDSVVVSISGDGGVMMNIQELATMRRYGIPLKAIVLNNSRLGMVRQWQELFFDGNFSEVDLSDNPDFAAVAQAFGIEGFTIKSPNEVPAAIERLLAAEGPILMHVVIDPAENVWPIVPAGKSNSDMMDAPK